MVWLEAFELVRILVRWSLGVFVCENLENPNVQYQVLGDNATPKTRRWPHNSVYISGHGSVWWGMASVWQCMVEHGKCMAVYVGANGGWANYASWPTNPRWLCPTPLNSEQVHAMVSSPPTHSMQEQNHSKKTGCRMQKQSYLWLKCNLK